MRKKKIGVRELARLARVSVGTVDRALNGRKDISEKTRKRILDLATKHGYVPDLAARALSVGRAPIRIGVCLPRHFPAFYDQICEGILQETARYRQHAVIDYQPTDHLGRGECEVVARVLESNVQALIVTPGDPVALAPTIDWAETERNARVICVASDDSASRRSTWIGVDPKINGMMAGELMANFLPGGSRAAIVTGMLKTEDHARKVEGFSQVFLQDCRGGSIAAVIEGNDYQEETYKKTLGLLREGGKIDGLYVSTAIGMSVCRALEQVGLAGKIKVIATDLFPELVPHLCSGTISALVHQRPYRQGQSAVRLLMDYFINGTPLPEKFPISPGVVLRSNVGLFREVRPRHSGIPVNAPANTA